MRSEADASGGRCASSVTGVDTGWSRDLPVRVTLKHVPGVKPGMNVAFESSSRIAATSFGFRSKLCRRTQSQRA